jgi:enterobacterial common antigen flippase
MSKKTSYEQILRSSSIVGGASLITMLLGMIRTKFAAVFISTGGVALLSGFGSIQGVIGIIAGLGIQSSAVREIAVAVGKGDNEVIALTVLMLRRISWFTGLVGMAVMMAFSPILSRLTFNSDVYTFDIAALGLNILLLNLAGAHLALLQGMRKLGDMARANIGSAMLSTLTTVGFYHWLGLRGIVPSLISIAAFQLAIAWYFARRVPLCQVTQTWKETFIAAHIMVKLGFVFMCSALMAGGIIYSTIILLARQIDLNAVAIYSAAFLLSGMSVNFVLAAMGADYYPRLVGVAHDKALVNRLVNEQTEIGLLLSTPGLLFTMVLAPWIIQIFYTREFLSAVDLLQWFVLGCLGRVISWPLGFVMLALGKGRWFLITEIGANFVHLGLIFIGLKWFGIEGVAIAFFALYAILFVAVYLVCRHLTGYTMSNDLRKISLYLVAAYGVTFLVCKNLSAWPATLIGIFISIIIGFFCLREIVHLLGPEHRIVRIISILPGAMKFLLRKV